MNGTNPYVTYDIKGQVKNTIFTYIKYLYEIIYFPLWGPHDRSATRDAREGLATPGINVAFLF